MARFMGLSITECWQRFLSEPLIFIKMVLIFLWMKILRPKRRLDLYSPKDMDTSMRGPFILPIEKEAEEPVHLKDESVVDSVLVFGMNSLGDSLLAKVSRERKGNVYWLYLRLSDGRIFQPATSQTIFPPSESHSAGGLRIKCLVPMRRWRISYNGILREYNAELEKARAVHVQFSFICISSAPPLDLTQGISDPVLAEVIARKANFRWLPDLRNLGDCLDRFVQSANFVGSITIGEDDEKEIYLWGIRQRTKDRLSLTKGSSSSLKETLGYTEDGQVVYAGEYHLPSLKQKLVFGLHLERCGHFWPAKSCSIDFGRSQKGFEGVKIDIKSERSVLAATAGVPTVSFDTRAGVNRGFIALAHITDLQTDDGDKGNTITLEYKWTYEHDDTLGSNWFLPPLDGERNPTTRYVLSLADDDCKLANLSGGKGSSLANLTFLAKTYPTNFEVPNGFVVTTAAYKDFFSTGGVKPMFSSFEKTAWCGNYDSLKTSCQQLVDNVSKVKLPLAIQKEVSQIIQKEYAGDISGKRFAVRSSASGEDSEDMSAAGQMSTFLGVAGMDNIFKSIVKCWASQFSFTAIQYKRQNGQELNSMMAVVVQEMVPADVAGVLFTCDPVSGNPQNVTITANYGLGESVVSASAEPDTIVFFRDEVQQLSLKSVEVGRKSLKVVMTDEGSVTDYNVDEQNRNVCSVSDQNALKLARTSLKIEEAYGIPLDIEWALRNNQLYMLQARPITTFDKETKFELLRSVDESVRTENEYLTNANAGEALPNAVSHLGITLFSQVVSLSSQYCYIGRNPYAFPVSPFTAVTVSAFNFCLINVTNMFLRFHRNGTKSFLTEAGQIAAFGRVLDDQEMLDYADRRSKTYPTTFVPYQLVFFVYDMLFGPKIVDRSLKKFNKENPELTHCSTSMEMFNQIWKNVNDTIYTVASHYTNSISSSLYNNLVMYILRSATKEWNADVFSDFSSILTSCGDLESADIPQSINKIAHIITEQNDAENFKKLSHEDALKWLETTKTEAGKEFKKFINRHGHRCLMEFDVYSKPWRIDKIPIVKSIQESLEIPYEEKKFVPVSDVIRKMKSPLSWLQKSLLRILIPLCRKSVMGREKSKSLFIKYIDHHRKGLSTLAEQMMREGRLPDKELLYFLSTYEVLQLLETRNPTLVQRAVRRRALFPELDNFRFPEICRGVAKPTNIKDRKNYDDIPSDVEVKGTPVSKGTVEGYARVAVNLEQAALIKRGEILIAHSTDVAWSPYFPLLRGVATELGGLVSHGAVVAREYGLPCVLGVSEATLKFKTGDYVILDGNKGILKRIPGPSEEKN